MTDGYCNLDATTVEPMYPATHTTSLTLNTRQVELVRDDTADQTLAGVQRERDLLRTERNLMKFALNAIASDGNAKAIQANLEIDGWLAEQAG